jgi:hypothetical protein
VKTHQDPDGDFLSEPGFGVDRHVITVPPGKKLTRYDLIKLNGGCKGESSPRPGATGTCDINVTWWHLPLGRARYKLHVIESHCFADYEVVRPLFQGFPMPSVAP